jgi:hypothetical protein
MSYIFFKALIKFSFGLCIALFEIYPVIECYSTVIHPLLEIWAVLLIIKPICLKEWVEEHHSLQILIVCE